jgi:serine/threonine protein kinase
MGIVYRACQLSLNRMVAIKVMINPATAHPTEVERFHLEAHAAARLQHPHVVGVHEVGEDQGVHFFSMDFVQGTNLANLVRSGPLTAERAASYVKIIADAIHYAHGRGIVHRDLKPANVLIDQFDQPRITDFGLAKLLQGDASKTQAGQILGSPHYMSPEQEEGRGEEVSVQSDVYALGAILYHLLCGYPPFGDQRERKADSPSARPTPPRRLNPRVPRKLETICLTCLAKDPQHRYASAGELAAKLACFLHSDRNAIWSRPWSWCENYSNTLNSRLALRSLRQRFKARFSRIFIFMGGWEEPSFSKSPKLSQ